MSKRDVLQEKRLELAILEADVRIEDLEAEIEKVKAKKLETEDALSQLKNPEEVV